MSSSKDSYVTLARAQRQAQKPWDEVEAALKAKAVADALPDIEAAIRQVKLEEAQATQSGAAQAAPAATAAAAGAAAQPVRTGAACGSAPPLAP